MGEEAAAVGISDDEKEEFKKLDIDNDGSLSIAELQAWESGSFQAEEAVKKLFLHADKDEDSQRTGKELEDAREEIASFPDGDAHMYLSIWHDVHNERGVVSIARMGLCLAVLRVLCGFIKSTV